MKIQTLTEKGYLLIPKAIRKSLGIKPGAKVMLVEENGHILIKPVPDDPIAAYTGFDKGNYSLVEDLLKERRKDRGSEERKIRGR